MTPELIGIVTVGVALAGLALVSIRENARVLRTEITAVRGEMARLRERMARIEGMFDGFLRRDSRQARESRRESETAAA